MRKVSELPDFSSVLDAHLTVLGADLDYEDEDQGAWDQETPQPIARQWMEALPTHWPDGPTETPFVVPLRDLVTKIATLSGETVPALDEAEGKFDTVAVGLYSDAD